MNYIEQFMKDNGLTFNTYFKVDGSSANYRFDSDYRLWGKPPGGTAKIADATLWDLLTGKLRPITKMERVAKILGTKLNEKFNIDKNGIEPPVGPFRLTEYGLENERRLSSPTALMKLLTGEYKIVPIEQED